ncbi:Common central domain of tyrosinase domain containing protein [Lactarius tabidus]
MSHFVTTGAIGGIQQGAAAPNRIEINDFVKNEAAFSLLIQSLNRMFQISQSNPTSHFSLASMHGFPLTPLQGPGGPQSVKGSQWGGHCTHGSTLFPCWHRVYVCRYEKVLQENALDIANTYEVNKQFWVDTAWKLRMPYWDWARNCVPPPEVIFMETVNIITPNGKMTSVPNPLLKYTFNPVPQSFPHPYNFWKTTIRSPNSPNSSDASTDVQGLIDNLSSIQDDITSSTYKLLTSTQWPAFGNHSPSDGGSASNSLEAIHDKIHGSIGGHMGNHAVAVFDFISSP